MPSVNDCPTDENPKVNFYGEQSENPYCQVNIDNDKCMLNKDNHVSNSCQYNYLKMVENQEIIIQKL